MPFKNDVQLLLRPIQNQCQHGPNGSSEEEDQLKEQLTLSIDGASDDQGKKDEEEIESLAQEIFNKLSLFAHIPVLRASR